MITNKMKAKIYSLYLKHEVQTPDGAGTLRSVHADGFIQAKPIGLQMEEYRCDECQLILKNISEITDEDANRCYTDLGYSHEGSAREDILSAFYGIPKLLTNLYSPYDIIRIADWLRQNGFAIDYMGIDLFESGIAIPKQ